MLLSNGAQTLKDYAARTFKKEVLTIPEAEKAVPNVKNLFQS
mgnify:CR=1 FL=1